MMKLDVPNGPLCSLALAGLLAMTACTSVSGTIEGDRAQATSAYFVQVEVEDTGFLAVVVYSRRNACEADEAFWDDWTDAEDAEEQEEAWAQHMPEDLWEFVVYILADPDDDLSGEDIETLDWDELFNDENQAYLEATHYTQLLDEDYFAGEEDPDDYFEGWLSDGGTFEVSRHEPGDLLTGKFEAPIVDPTDGDDEGEITLNIQGAERCRDMEDYLFP